MAGDDANIGAAAIYINFKISIMTSQQTGIAEASRADAPTHPAWKLLQIGTFHVENVRSFDEMRARVLRLGLSPAVLTSHGLLLQADKNYQ